MPICLYRLNRRWIMSMGCRTKFSGSAMLSRGFIGPPNTREAGGITAAATPDASKPRRVSAPGRKAKSSMPPP